MRHIGAPSIARSFALAFFLFASVHGHADEVRETSFDDTCGDDDFCNVFEVSVEHQFRNVGGRPPAPYIFQAAGQPTPSSDAQQTRGLSIESEVISCKKSIRVPTEVARLIVDVAKMVEQQYATTGSDPVAGLTDAQQTLLRLYSTFQHQGGEFNCDLPNFLRGP